MFRSPPQPTWNLAYNHSLLTQKRKKLPLKVVVDHEPLTYLREGCLKYVHTGKRERTISTFNKSKYPICYYCIESA